MENRIDCNFSKNVNCISKECSNCGWNPDVKVNRIDKFLADRKNKANISK